jgi:hypothetical protein
VAAERERARAEGWIHGQGGGAGVGAEVWEEGDGPQAENF